MDISFSVVAFRWAFRARAYFLRWLRAFSFRFFFPGARLLSGALSSGECGRFSERMACAERGVVDASRTGFVPWRLRVFLVTARAPRGRTSRISPGIKRVVPRCCGRRGNPSWTAHSTGDPGCRHATFSARDGRNKSVRGFAFPIPVVRWGDGFCRRGGRQRGSELSCLLTMADYGSSLPPRGGTFTPFGRTVNVRRTFAPSWSI